ncbi:DUF4430 domain-containing protein [Sporolactobacillus pectinivorans]|uniref:DUF4430 domain-containing protein n=1 Tax=Sporolactobacillus pectinivorans TaxID=1591408 RepID=UPI000C2669C2|nr:DUF4430 domain-containing protein [Sporolactobacillus pectinivorans]
MKKILLTLVLPILAIVIGIGLVIGSFQVQAKKVATHPSVAVQTYSSGSSASTDHKNNGNQSMQKVVKKEKQSGQSLSAAGSKKVSQTQSSAKSSSSMSSGKSSTSQSVATNTVAKAEKVAAKNNHAAQKNNQSGTSQQTASSSSSSSSAAGQQTVSITIQGLNGFNTQGPVTYRSNDSVFSELQRFTEAKHIELSYYGFGSSIYVSSINNQEAGQTSPASGWMYTVNGKAPNISAGAYHVQPNDAINWYYSK